MQTVGQMVGERPGIPLLQWWENVKYMNCKLAEHQVLQNV